MTVPAASVFWRTVVAVQGVPMPRMGRSILDPTRQAIDRVSIRSQSIRSTLRGNDQPVHVQVGSRITNLMVARIELRACGPAPP